MKMRQLKASIFLIVLVLLSSCNNPLGTFASGTGAYQPGTPAGGGGSSSVPITVTGVSLASNNTLSITGSGLDQATNVSITGIGAFTILSQTATTLTAQASASFRLVLGTLYNLVISSAEASGGTTIDFNVSGANSGSVLFADGSGNATSDNGKFYWDSTAHRLGIGTASPAAALNVIDAANTWPLMVDANTSTNASTWGLSFGAQNSVSARTGYADVQATLVSDTAGAESGQLDFHVMNSGASNDAMTILNSGNVGIGTSSPTTNLQVQATTSARLLVTNSAPTGNPNSSITLQNYRGTWGGGDPSIVSYIARGTVSSPTAITAGMKLLSLQGKGYACCGTGFGSNIEGASIEFVAESTWANSVIPTYITFNTASTATWNTSERMRITSKGLVGIGTTTPGYLLQVGNSGDGTVAEANAWNTFSDARLKTNVHPIEKALEKVLKLRGVSFVWKKDKTGKKNLGFIAQELEKVFPEFVTTGRDGYKSVSYGNITAVLASAIHELYAKVFARLDNQDQRIRALESSSARAPASVSFQKQIDALKQENAALKARLDQLERKLNSK